PSLLYVCVRPLPRSPLFPYTTLFRSENVLASLFFAGLSTFEREHEAHWVRAVYFAENWEDEENFVPETYIDVSHVWEKYAEAVRSEEHTSELQSRENLVCRLLLEKKN